MPIDTRASVEVTYRVDAQLQSVPAGEISLPSGSRVVRRGRILDPFFSRVTSRRGVDP